MLELALQLIEKEKQIQIGSLDISCCNLKELPSELADLYWLEELDISSNEISDISLLANMLSLEQLDCNHNKISDITPLENLLFLKLLALGDNQIRNIHPLVPLLEKGLIISNNYYDGAIELWKNPILVPPPLIMNAGTFCVLEYFRNY